MSTLRPCNMRGPRLRTLLFLLLLLLTALTRTAFCQDEDGSEAEETNDTEVVDEGDTVTSELPTDPDATTPSETILIEDPDGTNAADKTEGSGDILVEMDPFASDSTSPPDEGNEDGDLSPIIILIPVVLVVVIIGMIVSGIFINRKWNNKARNQELRKEDPYLDGPSTEKVPMPMFEEDVPSVLELEMEELDQWMKKDGDAAEDSKQA